MDQGVVLHDAQQVAHSVVGVRTEPGPHVELGGRDHVARLQESLLVPPDRPQRLVGFQQLGQWSEEHHPGKHVLGVAARGPGSSR